jgi:hypothetical protein
MMGKAEPSKVVQPVVAGIVIEMRNLADLDSQVLVQAEADAAAAAAPDQDFGFALS